MDRLELLKKLVSIPSVFPNEKELSIFICSYLEKIGFTIRKVPTQKNRNNIIAYFGKAKKYLGFYAHLDTVPPENGMDRPYEVKIKNNKAFGLGTEDIKIGITNIIKAGELAVEKNLPMKIIFCVDEEDISRGAHDVVDSGLLSDVSFIISAESGQVKDYKKVFNVCYGRKGRILFELSVFGKRTHAAESNRGVNAVEQAAKLLSLIKQMKLPKHKLLGQTEIITHEIEGATDSFSIPDTCTIRFSLLTTPNMKSSVFQEQIIELAKKQKIDIKLAPFKRETPYGESYEINRKDKFLKVLEKNIFNKFNIIPMYTPSIADENIFANRLKIPVVCIGAIGGGGHTKEEWVNLKSAEAVEEVYKQALFLFNKIKS